MKIMRRSVAILVFVMLTLGFGQCPRIKAASFALGKSVVKAGAETVYKNGSKLYAKGKNGKSASLGKAEGVFAVKKSFVYYTDKGTLYRVKTDGRKRKKLAASVGEILGIKGNSVITYRGKTIYRITGTKKQKAVTDRYMNKALYYNGKVYGVTGTSLYAFPLSVFSSSSKADAAWKKGVKIAKADYSNGFFVEGDFLYFVSSRMEEVRKVFRLGKKGAPEIVAEGKGLRFLAVSGGELLYTLPEGDKEDVYWKPESGGAEKIASQQDFKGIYINSAGSAVMSAGRIVIVWAGDDTDSGLFSMKKDGSGIRLISKAAGFENPEIQGNNVYAGRRKTEDGKLSYVSLKI